MVNQASFPARPGFQGSQVTGFGFHESRITSHKSRRFRTQVGKTFAFRAHIVAAQFA